MFAFQLVKLDEVLLKDFCHRITQIRLIREKQKNRDFSKL